MLTIIKITVLHFQIYIMMIEVNVVNILKTGVLIGGFDVPNNSHSFDFNASTAR